MNRLVTTLAVGTALVTIAAISATVLSGRSGTSGPAIDELTARVTIYYGYGTSTSDRPALSKAVRESASLFSQLDPKSDWLVCFAIDKGTREVRNKLVPPNAEALSTEIVRALRPATRKEGTNLAPFFVAVAERTRASKSNIAVICASDWFGEKMSGRDHAAVFTAAEHIAKNGAVKVVVVTGVKPGNWEVVRRDLGPVGAKLLLFGPGQFDPATIRQRLMPGGAF